MALMSIIAATVIRFALVRENRELKAREAEAERSGRILVVARDIDISCRLSSFVKKHPLKLAEYFAPRRG